MVLRCRTMRIAILDYNENVGIYEDIIVQSMGKLDILGTVDSFLSVSSVAKCVGIYNVIFIHLTDTKPEYISYAKKLRDISEISIVLFSDEDNYVWESFDINAVYYIRERFFKNEIDTVLLKLSGIVKRQEEELIFLQSGIDKIQCRLQDIVYIEANRKNSYIVYETRTINVKMSFSSLELIFLKRGFLKIHRSYMVNYRHIYKLHRNVLITDMGNQLPISKYRSNDVREEYAKLASENEKAVITEINNKEFF